MMSQHLRQMPADPELEDIGLFKLPIVEVAVSVTPKRSLNNRGDCLLTGYVNGTRPIEVLFAGRRRRYADPLISQINRRWSQLNGSATTSSARVDPEAVRLPISVLGTWRTRFEHDAGGWREKIHQLIVARWTLEQATGRMITHGEEPLHLVPDAGPEPLPRMRQAAH